MISIDQTVAKRLTLQYIVALSIVALLSIFGQVLIQVSLLDSSDNSHVINLAGRQRMLSQRLTKLTLLRSIKTQKWSPERQAEFENGFREWRKTHTGLRDNKLLDNKAYEVNNSPEIDAMFVEIKPYYNEMVKIFEQVNEGVEPTDKLISSLLENEKEFLHTMDKIVFEYDSKATKKVDRLRAFEFLIFILTILTLLIEFVYIFNPLVSYVRETIRQLLMSEKKLQIANNQLSQANKMLRDTQENLSKATKERYLLKMKEDKVRSASLLEGQEEERKRLSREIHDGLGQMLTGVKLGLGRLKMPEMSDKFNQAYNDVNKLINDTIETSRAVSFNLMPTVLNDFGISSALKIFINQVASNSNISIDLDLKNEDLRYAQTVEIAIYRIVQEAINNILKHANATKAKVSLEKKMGMIELSITDNGTGFDQAKLEREKQSLIHNGLENMKTRVELLNGTFKLTTILGEGTDIFIKLPIES